MVWRPCPHCECSLLLDTFTEKTEFACVVCGGLVEWTDYDLQTTERQESFIPDGWLPLPGVVIG